jgi:branched-chain amino acid transport system permease protein
VTLTVIDRALIDFPGARELAYGVALLVVFLAFPAGLAGIWRRWIRR